MLYVSNNVTGIYEKTNVIITYETHRPDLFNIVLLLPTDGKCRKYEKKKILKQLNDNIVVVNRKTTSTIKWAFYIKHHNIRIFHVGHFRRTQQPVRATRVYKRV